MQERSSSRRKAGLNFAHADSSSLSIVPVRSIRTAADGAASARGRCTGRPGRARIRLAGGAGCTSGPTRVEERSSDLGLARSCGRGEQPSGANRRPAQVAWPPDHCNRPGTRVPVHRGPRQRSGGRRIRRIARCGTDCEPIQRRGRAADQSPRGFAAAVRPRRRPDRAALAGRCAQAGDRRGRGRHWQEQPRASVGAGDGRTLARRHMDGRTGGPVRSRPSAERRGADASRQTAGSGHGAGRTGRRHGVVERIAGSRQLRAPARCDRHAGAGHHDRCAAREDAGDESGAAAPDGRAAVPGHAVGLAVRGVGERRARIWRGSAVRGPRARSGPPFRAQRRKSRRW